LVTPKISEDKEMNKNIEIGLDFILNHFDQNRLFPRTIMTKKLGYQKEVFSKEEAMKLYEESDFIDCRINAFPSFTDYKGIQRYPPNLIFIDIDKNNFKTKKMFKLALSRTLKNINKKLDGFPTVLLTGGGYHIYQPIDAFVLEEFDFFNEFENPSKQFLRFAKYYLSNNKADKANSPSFKSCLLRIPFSLNSKRLSEENDNIENSQVKITQEWDKKRHPINYLLRDFRMYLIDQKVKEINKNKHKRSYKDRQNNNNNNTISWIEQLLKIPIVDYRKNALSLILAPYLIHIKKLSYQDSFDILIDWLTKCDSLRKLDFNPKDQVKSALKTTLHKRILPMKLETLKNRNFKLYNKFYR
jgi:non-catalytic primase subunit PriX-like protein